MTRGNQREMDRAKNAKKQSSQKKGREVPEGLTSPYRDAEIMRKKQLEAQARKQNPVANEAKK